LVPYSSSEKFEDVLERLIDELDLGGSYTDLTKTGLYFEEGDYSAASWGYPAAAPSAQWYLSDGVSAPSTPPTYIGNGGTLVKWNLSDSVGGANTYAYIRWLADVTFDINGGVPPAPSKITGIDEGTSFASLTVPANPAYPGDTRTFKGWFDSGNVKYTEEDGTAVATAPDVTGNLTLIAKWGVEVKFYYTGTYAGNVTGAKTGTDVGGTYVIVDVGASNKVNGVPGLSKTGFTNNYLIWYEGGVTVPAYIDSISPLSAAGCFNPADDVLNNTIVYANWYAEVKFNIDHNPSAGFFSSVTKYMLEDSKLSDLEAPPYNLDLNPFSWDTVTRGDWEFVGWFESPAVPASYEDLGIPYYSAEFDYLQDGSQILDSTSAQIKKNVTLNYEYVVLVDFDGGYTGSAPIASKYLRVEMPIPDSGPRFTPKPVRAGITFMGWYDQSVGTKYTENVRDSDAPNTTHVTRSMKLTAAWLVTVNFFDYPQYVSDGLVVSTSPTIIHEAGPDGILGTIDDYFEMPEGTTIRQFITVDPFVAGKTFVSWFVEMGAPYDGLFDTGDMAYGLNDPITGDITLSAGYGFVLSFNTNGGTPAHIPDILVIEGQDVNLPDAPAKRRLSFNGWDDGATVYDAGENITPTSNATFTAKWLVKVTIYDGIMMVPLLSMEWDEATGPSFVYTLTQDIDYNNKVVLVTIAYVDPILGPQYVEIEKFIDKYDPSIMDWVSYYSVFDGWIDIFTGTKLGPMDPLSDLFTGPALADSMALMATWNERIRFYDTTGALLSTAYVDSGAYFSGLAPGGFAGWADAFSPTLPLNPATYRVRDSSDFIAIKFITVTFDAAGGAPATQIFNNVISGTMMGAVPAVEPARSGAYFAGWYDGGTKYSFTDKLYDDITLTAKWQSTPVERYTVFATAYANATISPQGMIPVMAGDSLRFDYYADRGYTPILRVDGVDVPATGGSYVFNNIRSDHSIEVFADNRDIRDATAYLTVNISGKGGVLYSIDNGTTFTSYVSPLPLFAGAEYLLKAVPGSSSYFINWSGDASGNNPEVYITSDGVANKSVTAHFGSSSGFGIGSMAIVNLMCMILAVVIGMIALAVAYKRNYEGTGVGKGLRFGAVIIALIAVVLFFLTQGFSGTYVTYDKWSIVMAILTLVTLVMALVSMKYDYSERD
ncbi:MAG: InlB B-repeat-containing protein, partial [Methanomassiliicoccaceae archaeon]|nr:InlB B-repeat-containing protein [Methanomassiliicoccaceae archaeon]